MMTCSHFTGECHRSLSRWRRPCPLCQEFVSCMTSSASCSRQILIGSAITFVATKKRWNFFMLWYAKFIIGSRPNDHYFRSVCLSVCLFVCLSVCLFVCLCTVFSAVFDPISIKLGLMLHVWVKLCPLEYRGCATPEAG